MDTVPSPVDVTSWPQVVALALLLLAFVTVPAVIGYLQLRQARSTHQTATDTQAKTADVLDAAQTAVTTLTQNNGGSSVVDRFDQLSSKMDDLFARIEELEGVPRPVDVPTTSPAKLPEDAS